MRSWIAALLLVPCLAPASQQAPLSAWLESERAVAEAKLRENISPPDAKPGVVIASPQRAWPDYYFHWIRDAALVMDVVLSLAERAPGPAEREGWESLVRDFTVFSRSNQLAPALTGLGEPKFLVNGEPFNDAWSRPQSDGPALRAVALIRWANKLLDRGEHEYVRSVLYRATLPADTVIKTDLEYVSHHWRDPTFDLWEELKADHFYTRLAQWKALTEGAALALRLDDAGASAWYQLQANQLRDALALHESPGAILPWINHLEGAEYKTSGLDISVVLAVLHTYPSLYSVADPRVLGALDRLSGVFREIYPINKIEGVPGLAIGRYPEDRYTATHVLEGNPWVLCTLAAAELYFRKAEELSKERAENLAQAKAWIAKGEEFLARVRYHTPADGSLPEQLNRHTGFVASARDLTWSYAAFLTAYWSRERALASLPSGATGE